MTSTLKKHVSIVVLLFYLAASSVATVHGSTSPGNQYSEPTSHSDSCHGVKKVVVDESLNSLACEMFCTVMSQVISTSFLVADITACSYSIAISLQMDFPSVSTFIEPRPPKQAS